MPNPNVYNVEETKEFIGSSDVVGDIGLDIDRKNIDREVGIALIVLYCTARNIKLDQPTLIKYIDGADDY